MAGEKYLVEFPLLFLHIILYLGPVWRNITKNLWDKGNTFFHILENNCGDDENLMMMMIMMMMMMMMMMRRRRRRRRARTRTMIVIFLLPK